MLDLYTLIGYEFSLDAFGFSVFLELGSIFGIVASGDVVGEGGV